MTALCVSVMNRVASSSVLGVTLDSSIALFEFSKVFFWFTSGKRPQSTLITLTVVLIPIHFSHQSQDEDGEEVLLGALPPPLTS